MQTDLPANRENRLCPLLRNGIAISLLLILGCPFLGTRGFLLLRKHHIRSEVKERILAGVDKNELVYLAFSSRQTRTDLRWEHDREFEYRGEMYDIVQSETRNDSVFYHCIHDRAETAVNRQLETLTASAANTDPPSQNSIQQLLDFLKNLCSPATRAMATLPTFRTLAVHFYLGKPGSPPASPPSPPPEVFDFSTM